GSGLRLFSGWRAEPRPELLSSRLIHRFFVLREWRGGLHLNATTAMGLGPVEAILTNEGEGQARGFGWTGPFPDCSGLSMRHDEAEAITDQLTGVVYERALSPAERAGSPNWWEALAPGSSAKWPRYLSIRPRRRGFVALSGHAPRRVIAGVPGRWLGGRTWLPRWDRRTR
ncbi:MAG TPA: hypothetical protein VFM91_02650, partial [Propionibacteriaceae bacterium]|nr:hypothetical protein [Propionibacteriaceae bacterium]